MSEKKMNTYEKLLAIQTELKAPKNQTATDFKTGKVRYRYRSCEDILEALKPLLAKYNCTLQINDSLELIGERYYIMATAVFIDSENEGTVTNSAYARETLDNGRMDSAQITGAASSYARKYALNGLFLIDDTQDVDTDEYREAKKADPKPEKKVEEKKEQMITEFQIKKLKEICDAKGYEFDEEGAKKMTMKEASYYINQMSQEEE